MIEVAVNTGVGVLGSWLITMVVLNYVENKPVAATLTVTLCTVWSLIRGYHVRRHFNKKLAK
jgi:steroid 5-alpha reductase family enzyme